MSSLVARRAAMRGKTPVRRHGGNPTGAQKLAGREPEGLFLDFTDRSALVRSASDQSDRINTIGITDGNGNFRGPEALLTYASPSAKLTLQSDGVYRYQAHNLLLQSNNLASTWVGSGCTLSTNKITCLATSSYHNTYQTLTTLVAGGTYVISARVARDTVRYVSLGVSVSSSLCAGAGFDLQSGTVTGAGAVGAGYAAANASIVDVGGGYFDCAVEITQPATTNYPEISLRTTPFAGGSAYYGEGWTATTADAVFVSRVHFRRTPSDSTYLATTSAAKYGLPFEWNAGGVLQGILVEPQATNLFLNSGTGATQTITVSNATAYTVSFFGTGSITFSGANSSTLNGTGATNRVSTTFTTASTSLICTVSGSITNVQVETGSVATSPIITYAATVTRAADDVTLAASAFPTSNVIGSAFAQFTVSNVASGDKGIITITDANGEAIFVNTATIKTFDGTNTVSSGISVSANIVAKAATSWTTSGSVLAQSANGNNAVTGTFDGTMGASTTLRLGETAAGTNIMNGYLQKVMVLPRAMSTAELKTVTT